MNSNFFWIPESSKTEGLYAIEPTPDATCTTNIHVAIRFTDRSICIMWIEQHAPNEWVPVEHGFIDIDP